MKRKLTITLFILCLLCFGIIGQSIAQTRLPGVNVYDNFVYSITSSWNSSNASATVPISLVEINNTVTFNVTVTYVANDNVTATNTWSFSNGTRIDSLVTFDTNSGNLIDYIPGLPAFEGFYDANLGVNDLLRPSGNNTTPVWINQTVTRNYDSVKRDTNFVTFSYPSTDVTNSSIGTTTTTFYIDKPTGVLVERKDFTEFPDQNGTILWTLKSTNLWTVSATSPQLPLPLPIIVAIVAVVIVVVVAAVYIRGRKGRRKKLRR